jgi:hypothetical protein
MEEACQQPPDGMEMTSQSINQVKRDIRVGVVMIKPDFGIASAADGKIGSPSKLTRHFDHD